MAELDKVTEQILEQISGGEFKQEGAYNLRQNGVPSVMEIVNM